MGGLSYVDVEQARALGGLRLVLTQGVPAPWGMAARVLYEVKKIPFVAVIQQAGADNAALVAWTGHNSAPVAMYEDERPRALWSEQLMLAERLDMVVGARKSEVEEAYRRGHRFGNMMLTGILARLFGRTFSDILSGYRVFSRRFVKSFPVLSAGFEIETEISIHALELQMPVGEIVTAYGARPEGSMSKLSTYRDGFRILWTIMTLFRIEKPTLFFGAIGGLLALLAIILAIPLGITYLDTGLVPRLPTALLATGLMILAVLNWFCGLILATVVRGRREVRRLAYLSFAAPGDQDRATA